MDAREKRELKRTRRRRKINEASTREIEKSETEESDRVDHSRVNPQEMSSAEGSVVQMLSGRLVNICICCANS